MQLTICYLVILITGTSDYSVIILESPLVMIEVVGGYLNKLTKKPENNNNFLIHMVLQPIFLLL